MKNVITTMLAFIVIFVSIAPASARGIKSKKNSLTVNTARSSLFDNNLRAYRPSIFNVTTFTYERKITGRVFLSLSYGQWFLFDRQLAGDRVMYKGRPGDPARAESTVWERFGYSYAGLNLGYTVFKWKAFQLNGYAGPSVAWGTNRYLNPIGINPFPESDIISTTDKKESTLGLMGGINCFYSFWGERVRAGVLMDFRNYPGAVNVKQLDFGLQVGVNF